MPHVIHQRQRHIKQLRSQVPVVLIIAEVAIHIPRAKLEIAAVKSYATVQSFASALCVSSRRCT